MCLYTDIKLKTKQLAKKKKKNSTDQFKATQSLLVMLCTDTDRHNKLVKVKYKLEFITMVEHKSFAGMDSFSTPKQPTTHSSLTNNIIFLPVKKLRGADTDLFLF